MDWWKFEAAIERSGKYGTGWQAAFDTPEEAGVVVEKILHAAERNSRPMDKDHFSAGFGVRFGAGRTSPLKRWLRILKNGQEKRLQGELWLAMAIKSSNEYNRMLTTVYRNSSQANWDRR